MRATVEQPGAPGASRRRGPRPGRHARAGVVAAGVAGVLLAGCSTSSGSDDPLVLTVPDTGGAMASCLPLTQEYLAEMSPAFAGTVTDVGADTVSMRVDRWYAGSGPDEVALAIPPGAHAALIGEIDFREGVSYLVTAVDGTVNLCGYSGEATAELRALFDAAF